MAATTSSIAQQGCSVEDSSVLIPLTMGYSARVDPEDLERFGRFKWTASVVYYKERLVGVYAYRKVCANGKKKTVYLHREIMGAGPGQKVDHISRETLDCRKSNLRWATTSQNGCNRHTIKASHGFHGIIAARKNWYGVVSVSGRSYYTKVFPSPVLAAAARDVLAQQLHGEFATLNFQFIPLAEVCA
jgi:hypothetical protein